MSNFGFRLQQLVTALLLVLVVLVTQASAETIARCGEGWLEEIDGYRVLHLRGTPYEMGYQHGALLKASVRENLRFLLEEKGAAPVQVGPVKLFPRPAIDEILSIQKKHVPPKYFEEMEGLAAGAELPIADVRAANFIPELFHCSGFAIANGATKDGTLYHGRVLDYATDWRLQEHAVLIVAEPKGGVPFVNISYAGFVGSVSGMNAEHVSIGEMGGGGLFKWEGVPMALLVREVLEQAKSLDEAVAVFRDNKRTCQYFYVIADGQTNQAVGMEAGADRFTVVKPGEKNELLHSPVKDCVLLSANERYVELVRRAKDGHGKFSLAEALSLMDRPVAMKSNLHNVLFEPRSTKLWVANAGKDGRPAADEKYHAFQLSELLKRQPDGNSRQIELRHLEKTAAR
jgi:hypothetical protein